MPPATTTPPERVCVGVVTGAHGVRGALRIKSFTADPAHVAAYGEVMVGERRDSVALRVTGQAKGALVGEMEGVTNRDAAQALKGMKLYVPHAALPEPEGEEYYHGDLVGLHVRSLEGVTLGTIQAVHNYGAGDILDIRAEDGGEIMLPFTRETVPEINLEAGYVVADPPRWQGGDGDENAEKSHENGSNEG